MTRTRLLLAAGLLLQALLAVDALRRNAPTFDEPAHLVAGVSYWRTGDFRLNPEHPPLAKLLAAAPVVASGARFDTDDEVWRLRRQWEMARRFLYRWNEPRATLLRARLPMVAVGLLLSWLVFVFARRLYGEGPGLLAFACCVLSPDVLAHSGLVTTDVPLAAAFLGTVLAAHDLALRPCWRAAVVLGLVLGAALATKFSALLLLPILLALLVRVLADGGARGPLLRATALAAGVALGVVWASYGFHARLSPDDEQQARTDWSEVEPGARLVPNVLHAARAAHLLPEAWVYGCLRFLRHAEGRPAFLHGQLSDEGFRAFFPVSFAVKTPLPLLLLLALGFFARAPLPSRDAWFLWLPPLTYAAFSVASALNIGHRHLLPVYPFLFVAGGRAALLPRRVPAVLGGLLAASVLRVHPHELAYFNEAAGGPPNGYRWLVDSSLDWGQDLQRLGDWCAAHGVRRVKLAYFGTADPWAHGVPAEMLPSQTLPRPAEWIREVRPGDVVAVSATLLQGLYVEPQDRELFAQLRARTPVARVGFSIFVYRADFTWSGRAPSPPAAGTRAADPPGPTDR